MKRTVIALFRSIFRPDFLGSFHKWWWWYDCEVGARGDNSPLSLKWAKMHHSDSDKGSRVERDITTKANIMHAPIEKWCKSAIYLHYLFTRPRKSRHVKLVLCSFLMRTMNTLFDPRESLGRGEKPLIHPWHEFSLPPRRFSSLVPFALSRSVWKWGG